MEGEPFAIPVFCRPNPFFYRREEDDALYENCLRITGNEITVTDQGQVRTFTDVFRVLDPGTSQAELYEQVSSSVRIAEVVNGYNSTILAYGQTGGGKTYTMTRDPTNEEKKGIISRTLETVFVAIERTKLIDPALEFTVTVSYLSIYNENVVDLFSGYPDKNVGRALQVKQRVTEGVYVQDLLQHTIHTAEEGVLALQRGMQNRLIGNTRMGQCSARMSILFYISVLRRDHSMNTLKTGTIILADLAGSERVHKSGCSGVTLKEARMVGMSHCALNNVLTVISGNATKPDKQDYIPYRDSKVTRLLQDSLGGTTRTAFCGLCEHLCYE